MNPNKSPGEDGLIADICSRAIGVEHELLLKLLNLCLRTGTFPKIWKRATIKVIPKSGRDDYSVAKSYRQIGLLPILGKILESF